MLIGIVVRSVMSKKSCALDGSPSCVRNARQALFLVVWMSIHCSNGLHVVKRRKERERVR
jgi:hypothetical protein